MGIGITATRYLEGDVERSNSVELGYSTGSFWYADLNQAFEPFAFIASGVIIGLLVGVARTKGLLLLKGLVVSTLLLCAPVTFLPLISPTGIYAYEWVEDISLYHLMDKQAVEDGRWISNDLADPAGDFQRRLNALHLTSSLPAQFYVSNLRYGNYLQDDALSRLLSIRRFYLTEWSDWHSAFLVANEIQYVLVNQRCEVAWKTPSGLPYSESSVGPWILLRFDLESLVISETFVSDHDLPALSEGSGRCM